MDTPYSVKLKDIIEEFHLEVVYAPEGYEDVLIVADDVNRPGLQLTGFFDYFDSSRIQILGKVENTYLDRCTDEERMNAFEMLMSRRIPAVIKAVYFLNLPNHTSEAAHHLLRLLFHGRF